MRTGAASAALTQVWGACALCNGACACVLSCWACHMAIKACSAARAHLSRCVKRHRHVQLDTAHATGCAQLCIHSGRIHACDPSLPLLRCLQASKFQEWPFLEDLEWVQSMKRNFGMPRIVPQAMMTSPRRWLHYGIAQTTIINQLVLAGYALGVPVPRLHRFYMHARRQYVDKDEGQPNRNV